MRGGLRRVDFILDRSERGETPEEIARAEGLPLDQVQAVLDVEEDDELDEGPETPSEAEDEGPEAALEKEVYQHGDPE